MVTDSGFKRQDLCHIHVDDQFLHLQVTRFWQLTQLSLIAGPAKKVI